MFTLRVLYSAPPATDAAQSWALVDAHGAITEEGRGPRARWPGAARCEAVLGAEAVRVLALALPPLTADRLDRAVAYALEERLATPVESALVVTSPQRADGQVTALVVDRSLARALLDHAPRFARVLAEPQLVALPPADAWRWCAARDRGFVVTPRGETFATTAATEGAPPAELALALARAARAGDAPQRVIASTPDVARDADAWARACGVAFVPGPAWHWARGDAMQASDLTGAFTRALAPPRPPAARPHAWRFAGATLVVAGALHVVATAATWAWHRIDLARTQAAITATAHAAGADDAVGLARMHAVAHHRAGRSVPADAWPRLAQAAPALAALPAGTLRTARYGGGAWTLELAPLDDIALAAFEGRLRTVGMSGVVARTPALLRVRLEAAS